MRTGALTLFALILFWPVPSGAEGLDTRGVGYLDIGPLGCTGTLIAPDLVLTAAHCLLPGDGGAPVQADQISFHPTTPTGQIGQGFPAERFAVHPVFEFPGLTLERRVTRDLGIIQLIDPVPPSLATPIQTGSSEALIGKGFIISFRGALSRSQQRACTPISAEHGLIQLGCVVNLGNSGAPYLALNDGELSVVAVISGSSTLGKQPIGLAADLRAGLGGLLEVFNP